MTCSKSWLRSVKAQWNVNKFYSILFEQPTRNKKQVS